MTGLPDCTLPRTRQMMNSSSGSRSPDVSSGESSQRAGSDIPPIDFFFPDDAGPHLLPPDGLVIPIEALFFRGDAAIREALSLRPEIEAALGAGAEATAVRGLLDELWGLLRSGLPPAGSG